MPVYIGNKKVGINNKIYKIGNGGSFRAVIDGTFCYPPEESNFKFILPDEVTNLGPLVLQNAFFLDPILEGANLGITEADFNSLTTITGARALSYAFSECTNLTSVNLNNLTTINAMQAIEHAFDGCTGLTTISLPNLTTISGYMPMEYAFYGCSNLTSVNLNKLASINSDNTFYHTFSNCSSLTVLSFPSLTSTSFGSYTNQFNNMLYWVTGCTVHFPSNLQSVIGSWSDVIAGFGGTNTTVLFDLTATT